jgi:hypothetical protein
MPSIPCILCGKQLERRTDKNGKSYFTCDPCGTQYFIRRKQGIEKLERLMGELNKHGELIHTNAQTLYEIQAILSEIEGRKSEIEKLGGQLDYFFPDADKVEARNLLKTRIQTLLSELEKIAKRNREIK